LERAQIWDIVIKRHGRKPTVFDTVVRSRACEQFTGAEIEAVFIDALHEAFAEVSSDAGPDTGGFLLTTTHTGKVKPESHIRVQADENTSHAAGTPMITAQPTSLTANSLTGTPTSNPLRDPSPALRARIPGSQMNSRGNRKSSVARIASGSPPPIPLDQTKRNNG
jgi:hypothetical protein